MPPLESLLVLILVLAFVGFVLWLVIKYVPMPAPWPQVMIAVVILFVLLAVIRWLPGGWR